MLVLVAEDNPDNFALLERFLKRRGCEVIGAGGGREAVALTAERRPDLVLMDLSLPDISGLDATARIRSDARTSATPIIAVTAHAMGGDRARCLEAGCTEYVSKPIDYDQLGALIDKLAAPRPA